MLAEFKKFIMRGNVLDMAVGIIIGTAFGKIISSLVSDILMPPIGMLLGKMDFSKLSVTLQKKTETTAAVTLNYGAFINSLIDFLIIAFAIFVLVKQVGKFMPKVKKEKTTKECPQCCLDIPVKAMRCGHCTSDIAG